jgi:DNA-binding transcriptional MerR regulator
VGHAVGDVAKIAGVSVRTLHHYDEIGLVSPSARNASGYRMYSSEDLQRLQHALFYRELGFPLDEIKKILDDSEADALSHLQRHHRLLSAKVDRLNDLLAAVERAMEVDKMGISLTPEERFEVFGDFKPEDYAEEAEERWGGTDAYKESQRRVSSYTKDDWLKMRAEQEDLNARLARAVRDGASPTAESSMDLAEEHRQQISRWFYDCGYEMHVGLGVMYLADPRFKAHYEDLQPGLAEFLNGAIEANAQRAGHPQT